MNNGYATIAALALIAASPVLAGMSGGRGPDAAIHAKLQLQAKPIRVTEQAARTIAWRSGVDHVEEIALFGERWEVAGRDRAGNEITLDINAHDGRVLN